GIRDKLVTGVQTCALPISAAERMGIQPVVDLKVNGGERADVAVGDAVTLTALIGVPPAPGTVVAATWDFEGAGTYPDAADLGNRSEERRGGKEGRAGGARR